MMKMIFSLCAKIWLLLLGLCYVMSAEAQNNAYYITNFRGADILKVDMSTAAIKEVISFTDTVKTFKKPEKLTHFTRFQ